MADSTLILRELLSLSRKHLSLAKEEAWEEWEDVADQKEALYDRLGALCDRVSDNGWQEMALEIERLERKTKDLIKQKRDAVKKELLRINRVKNALRGYGRNNSRSGSRGHFGIRC